MERIVIAMQDGGAGPRGQPHFLSPPNLYMGPPGPGGTFWFQIFIQASSPEIWSETISGAEGGLARKWGGLFWATSLEKIIGGVIAIISFRSTVTAKPR